MPVPTARSLWWSAATASILRAAEVTWSSGTPVLGVNLGHVGFLAEAESDDVEATIEAIVHRT